MRADQVASERSKKATKFKCNRCDSWVKKETNPEIDCPYYCPSCDENMYSFEVHYSLPSAGYVNPCL